MSEIVEHNPTKEQEAIYDFVENGNGNAIIDAVAGAGKTTTIIGCVSHIPEALKKKGHVLFCAFNQSTKIDLEKKFTLSEEDWVEVKTSYSLGRKILVDNGIIAKSSESSTEDEEEVKEKKQDRKCDRIAQSNDFIDCIQHSLLKIYNYCYEDKLSESFFGEFFEYVNNLNDGSTYYSVLKNKHEELSQIIDTLVEVNKKFRLTLAEDTPQDLYYKVLEHFGVLSNEDENNDAKRPTKDEIIAAYFEANHELQARSMSLVEQGEIDFADMVYLPYALDLYPKWSYRMIFIDECQDLSKAQQDVIFRYRNFYKGKNTSRIIAVGDPHQAIYGFNGADASSFESLAKRLDAKRFGLLGSFRCAKKVVEKAQEIKRDMRAQNKKVGKVEEISRQEMIDMLRPGDYVVSRAKHDLSDIIMELLPTNLPLNVIPENGKEVINSLLELFTDYELDLEVLGDKYLFKRNKQKVIRRNRNKIKRHFVVITEWDYIDREEETLDCERKIKFLFSKLLEWQCRSIREVFVKLEERLRDHDEDAIQLLTIHRAKGKEANRVFVLNADNLPLTYKNILPWEEEQEKNLLYVAYTRAIEELYLVQSDDHDDILEDDDFNEDEYES